jgi:hypothetical protein
VTDTGEYHGPSGVCSMSVPSTARSPAGTVTEPVPSCPSPKAMFCPVARLTTRKVPFADGRPSRPVALTVSVCRSSCTLAPRVVTSETPSAVAASLPPKTPNPLVGSTVTTTSAVP